MTPAEQKAPDIDAKIEIIRQALESRYGECSVNRGHKIAGFFYIDESKGIAEKHQILNLPKEFIEVLPLVDLEGTRGLVEHIADLLKDQKQYIKKCECRGIVGI